MQEMNRDQLAGKEISKNLLPLYHVMQQMEGKNVLILGYGREGQATLSMLQKLVPGARLTVADIREQKLPEGVAGVFGAGYQDGLTGYDVIIKSPGIVLTDKSPAVLERVTSQTELFLRAYRKQVIGITGTKGKSTTTALTWHILKSVRPDTLLMGNIGIAAFLQAEAVGPDTLIVYELSCHQLEYISVSPHVAVLLNLFEEHLDHYGTKEAYFNAKRNICRFQDADDLYFCNILQKDNVPSAKARRITMQQAPDAVADLSVIGREVHMEGHVLPLPEGCTRLAGEHNLYNIGAAYGICRQFGVTDDQFMAALSDFDPLPHRLQRVGTFDGVTYYDDSISTACETAIGAMKALAAEGVGSILLGLFFFGPLWIVVLLLLTPAVSLLGTLSMAILSRRAKDTVSCAQLSGYAALPVILLFVLQLTGLYQLDFPVLLVFGALALAADGFLWMICLRCFSPERLSL